MLKRGWPVGAPQVFERIRLVEISSRREGDALRVRIRNCVGMALARRLSVSVKAEIPWEGIEQKMPVELTLHCLEFACGEALLELRTP